MKSKATSLLLALVLCLTISPVVVHADVEALSSGRKFDFSHTSEGNVLSEDFWIAESGWYSFTPSSESLELSVLTYGDGAFQLYSVNGTWANNSYYVEFEANSGNYMLRVDSSEIQSVVVTYHGNISPLDWTIENSVLLTYRGFDSYVEIPDTVVEIGELALSYANMTQVSIPDSVTKIGAGAFSFCSWLNTLTIPKSVTEIEGLICFGSNNLTAIQVEEENPAYSSSDGILFNKSKTVLLECPVGKTNSSYVVPDSVVSIGYCAFSDCLNLTSITIPSSVTEIGEYAFYAFMNSDSILIPNLTIYGEEGSYAQTYCQENNIPFKSIGNSSQPQQPNTPDQPQDTPLAKAGNQDIEIDGTPVAFQTYMLADENGNGTNYVKLRDIAHVLNGTGAQFSVGYNRQEQSISAVTGEAYQDTGTEMDTPFAGADKEFVQSQLTIVIDGKPVQLDAITLSDDAGNGYNYFKLRDLGDALGFTVGYSRDRGVYVETR